MIGQSDMMATDKEKIITHISNFREVKQIPDVVKVFYNIQKEMPAKLMMVGEGPEREPAERLCEKLGISDKVIFFGNSNEIDKILLETEKTEFESTQFSDYEDQFQLFIFIALIFLFLEIFLFESKTSWIKKLNLFNDNNAAK